MIAALCLCVRFVSVKTAPGAVLWRRWPQQLPSYLSQADFTVAEHWGLLYSSLFWLQKKRASDFIANSCLVISLFWHNISWTLIEIKSNLQEHHSHTGKTKLKDKKMWYKICHVLLGWKGNCFAYIIGWNLESVAGKKWFVSMKKEGNLQSTSVVLLAFQLI